MKANKAILTATTLLLQGTNIFSQNNSIGTNIGKINYGFTTTFYHHGQSSILLIFLTAVLVAIFIALEFYYKSTWSTLPKTYFTWNAFSIESKNASSYTFTKLGIFALLGLVLSSITAFLSLTYLNIGLRPDLLVIFIAFLFQALLNYLAYKILDKTFSQKNLAKNILINTLYFWSTLSESTLILLILLIYVKSQALVTSFAIIWIFGFILLFARKTQLLLKIFSEGKFQLLHFILYFCAVELTPILLAFADIKL